MTYNGADGNTRKAMATALGFDGMTFDQVNRAAAALLANLEGPGPGVELRVANSLWARDGIEFKPDFLGSNRDFFSAEVTTLDFNSPRALSTINGWVSDKTKGKIEGIVYVIDPQAILFLVNAVYFKGEWKDKFEPKDTIDGEFTSASGIKKTMPMMHRHGEFGYNEEDGCQIAELPYGAGRVRMNIILPDRNSDVNALISGLDTKKLEKYLSGCCDIEGDIYLPRFKIEYEIDDQLKQALSGLGMGVAFDSKNADFSRMCPIPPLPNVWIDEVRHKTFLEVNEQGTEAAAATEAEMTLGCARPMAPEVVVDRPFVLVIRDSRTGAILFVGAIMDPVGGGS
jgi:serpin B